MKHDRVKVFTYLSLKIREQFKWKKRVHVIKKFLKLIRTTKLRQLYSLYFKLIFKHLNRHFLLI